MPLFSIIVPIYKIEEYLRQCLDSVLSQTFSDYECILVDDGSPDNCPAICNEYAGKEPCFRVIHKENGGLSDARNAGIQAATGEYIVLLDGDDFFADNEALKNLCKLIKETKENVIFNSNLTVFYADKLMSSDGINKNFICLDKKRFYKKQIIHKKIMLSGYCFIVNRDFILQHGLFFKKGIIYEDEHWIPRVICSASKIAINHDFFYVYRLGRSGSIMNTVTLKRCFDYISIMEDMLNWSMAKNIETFHRYIYIDCCIRLWKYVFNSISLLDTTNYQDIVLLLKQIKNYTPILFYKISVSNCVYYLLVKFINLSPTRYINTKKIMNLRRKITAVRFNI